MAQFSTAVGLIEKISKQMYRVTISIQSQLQHLMLIDMYAPSHLRPLRNSLLKYPLYAHKSPFSLGYSKHNFSLTLDFNKAINLLYTEDAMCAITLKLPLSLVSISLSL